MRFSYFSGMVRAGVVSAFLVMAGLPALGQSCGGETFSGAWFDILVPDDFQAANLVPSISADGYDAAEFFSPDGLVAFYVFAPQWSGGTPDIALNPATERLADERRSSDRMGARHRWWTIAARDGSYQRSYHETVSQDGTSRQILGLRYQDQDALETYRSAYACFKTSLERFAD